MCLIIQTNRDKEISRELFENITKRNDDGYGFMWIQKNKIHTLKSSVLDLKVLIETYQRLREYNPYIHFRMQTHGLVDHNNTHPYYVGWGMFLMHNGVMGEFTNNTDIVSDTHNFITHYLAPLLSETKNPHKAIRSRVFQATIERIIGPSNKIVIGDRGGFILLNERNWYTVKEETSGIKDCLVSNTYAWDERFNCPKSIVVSNYTNMGYNYYAGKWWNPNTREWEPHPPTPTQGTLPLSSANSDATKEKEHSSYDMELWKNNLYYDEKGRIWQKRKNVYIRKESMDKKFAKEMEELDASDSALGATDKELAAIEREIAEKATDDSDDLETLSREAKLAAQIERISAEIDAEEEAAEAMNNMTQDEYEIALVKNWVSMPEEELCNAVYEMPDEAAIVIYRLAHREY